MKQTTAALSEMNLAYGTSFDDVRLEYYAFKLSDIHPVTLAAAVSHLCNTSKYLPTVAEIRNTARRISDEVNQKGLAVAASPEEAWMLTLKAAQSGGYDNGLARLEGEVQRTAKLLWKDICYCPTNDLALMRAHFIRAYKENMEREAQREQVQATIKSVPALDQARQSKLAMLTEKIANTKALPMAEKETNHV